MVDAILRAQSVAEYRRLLVRLISEPEFRAEIGGRLASHVREALSADQWQARLGEVYGRLGSMDCSKGVSSVATNFMATRASREIVNIRASPSGPLALAEVLCFLHHDFPCLRREMLFAEAAMKITRDLRLERVARSSIPPRWWPATERFLFHDYRPSRLGWWCRCWCAGRAR